MAIQFPKDVSGFVNRAAELAQLDEMSATVPTVLVISGTAGVGKTSLAVHWAHQVKERFPDGQLYVNLRGYDPGEPVTAEVALDQFLLALGVQAEALPGDLAAKTKLYRSLIADRRVLVVADNAVTADQVNLLLPDTPNCLVVVTSRGKLPELAAQSQMQHLALHTLSETEAVSMLRSVTSKYRHTDDVTELTELAKLCGQLPLALRIAGERAAQQPKSSLHELILNLRKESALWGELSTQDAEKAASARTVFAWSYRALTPDASRLFRLLGLHPGPEFSAAAAAALNGTTIEAVTPLLNRLIDVHLLEQIGPKRYQFHDLLREYATDQATYAESAEERQAALHRVLTWYLHTAEAVRASTRENEYAKTFALEPLDPRVKPVVFSGFTQAIQWYEAEKDNLITAVYAAIDNGFDQIAWQIPAVLADVYGGRGAMSTWLAAGQAALAAAQRLGDSYGTAIILEILGATFRLRYQLAEADEYYSSALSVFRDIGNLMGEAMALNGLGLVSLRRYENLDAIAYFEQTLTIARTLENQRFTAVALRNLGHAYGDLEQPSKAEHFHRQAVGIYRALDGKEELAGALQALGEVQCDLGLLSEARETLREALCLAHDCSNQLWESVSLLHLSKLELKEAKPADALVSSQRAATIFRQLSYSSNEAKSLNITGEAYQQLGRLNEAADFHRRALAIHRELQDPWWSAVALHNLATTLDQSDNPDEARQARHEAVTLLAEVPGPRAATLRENLSHMLA